MASGTTSESEAEPSARVAPFVVPTKLRPPHLHQGLFDRTELVERLREGRQSVLTLVCAPAGYGKTTLLTQWAAADGDRTAFAWVSLDPLDSDPARLWGHVVSAIQQVHKRAGQGSLMAFAAGPRAITETGIPLFVAELSDCPDVVLVLEDWHTVTSATCDETVGMFVEHAPDAVQVVISSRHDPHLPIARLRAHGHLTELRAEDLSVSTTQAEALFRGAESRLTSQDIERLNERTEGWLAGLCLAAIVLRERPDPQRFVEEFSGDTRNIFDYLARDVVATAQPDVREFMVSSSILEPLSAPLCDVVLGRTDSAAMLAEIERTNLFLVPLDATGSVFRYHHLFADVLRRQLASEDPAVLRGLHARASFWYEEQGEPERAIDHAIASRDVPRVSRLVSRAAVPWLSAGRMSTLIGWFEALSWPEAVSDRELATMRALTAGLSGQGRDEIERWLQVAETGPEYGPLANGITSIGSAVAMISATYVARGVTSAEREARIVLDQEPPTSPWRYAGLVPLGQALFLAGRGEEARVPLEEARTLPGARQRATSILALAYLSLIELAAGDRHRAELLARDALALADEIGHAESSVAATAHLALGCSLTVGTDLHAAIEQLDRAVELAGYDEPSYWHVHSLLHLAIARHRVGDATGAGRALAQARAGLDELPDAGMLAELYRATDVALRHRRRPEGFVGEDLSEAERRVLDRLLAGLSLSQVARELWLSSNTVKTHRRNIYRKLDAKTREELIERAAEAGIVASSPTGFTPGE